MLISKIWRMARGTKAVGFLLLIFAPMFIRPLAFARQAEKPRPLYAKLPGLKGMPLLVAGVYATTVQSFYGWVFWKEMNKPGSTEPAAELLLYMHKTEWLYFWAAFASVAVMVYVLSFLCWGYHRGAILFLRKWFPDFKEPPLDYFIVIFSAWALWFGIFFKVAVTTLWHLSAGFDFEKFINSYVERNAGFILIFFVGFTIAYFLAGRNKELGMKSLYGGSSSWFLLVSNAPLVLMMLILYSF